MKKNQVSKEITEARKKMKEKFNSKEIRGRGVSRRKKKNINGRLKKVFRSTPEELKFNSCLKRINSFIYSLTEIEEYESAIVYIDDIVYFQLLDINKSEVIKKNIWREIKSEPCEFFEEKFYKENEEDRISIRDDSYYIIKNFFTVYGINNMIELFIKIEKSLYKKEYLEDNTENEEEMSLKNAYQILEINRVDEISSKDLVKIYRKKALSCHPDKHPDEKEKYRGIFTEIYKAYKFLLKRI